jgi:hypothetical protein
MTPLNNLFDLLENESFDCLNLIIFMHLLCMFLRLFIILRHLILLAAVAHSLQTNETKIIDKFLAELNEIKK